MLNCPNCSAPIDLNSHKCSYCGTLYYDMSCIDLQDRTPFYLKIKNGNMIITSLVVPKDCELTIEADSVDVRGKYGERLTTIKRSQTLHTNINFETVASPKIEYIK